MSMIDRRALLTGAAALALPWRGLAQSGPHSLAPLPYPYEALVPTIDALTMELHYTRHHGGQLTNLNRALAEHSQAAALPLHELLERLGELPESIRTAVRNNGGGHANHTMFWAVMSPTPGQPSADLSAAITRDFGDMDKLKEAFERAGNGRFGSGWAWVTVTRDGTLAITSTPNQDTPIMDGQRVLFGNDVWEHAYYLTYNNRRGDYLKAWWAVLDWAVVSQRYAEARAGTLTI
jgi:Fe-Mn family superoxide dismutase